MLQTNLLLTTGSQATGTKPSSQSLWGPAKHLVTGVIVAMILLSSHKMLADTFYSNASTGDPTQTTSWTNLSGANPANFTSGDTFIILNGANYTLAAGTTWAVNATTAGTAATIQINATGRLTFSLGSTTPYLQLGGNFVQTAASATVGLVGSGTSATGNIEFTSNAANGSAANSFTWTGTGDLSNIKGSIIVDAGVTLDASGMSAGFKFKSSNTVGMTVNGSINLGTLTLNANGNASAGFTLGASGTLITANTSASGLPGIFSGFSSGKVSLPTTANYTFDGAAAQATGTAAGNVTTPAAFNNLTVNNSAGVTLSQATEVDGTLALTVGILTGNVTLGSSAALSGGGSTAYINGQLTVPFSAPSGVSYTFPVGTASAYSPVSLANFTDANGSSGTLTASATAAQDPNPGSGIDGSLYIARYWTLTDNGGFSSPTYNFTGTYVAGDIKNGANPANLIVRKWDGSSWAAPAASSSVAYTVTGTGFTTSFGQFAAGEALTTLPVIDATTQTAVTNTSATLGATLENVFSMPVSEYGIVWGTSPSPTTANNKVLVGTTLAAPNSFTANVTGLPVATTIYYRGYAINATGTGYSTNGSFLTLTNEPTIQASGVSSYSFQNGNLSFSWVRGNGAKCIVLVNAVNPVDSNPVDGTTYTNNAVFGGGTQIGSDNYVVYLGTGTNVTVTGLSAATTYYVAVYELNGSGGSENYLAPPATGSQPTVTTPIALLTWTGSQDNLWNNPNNWDASVLPDVGTAVSIPGGTTYSPIYANPMVAASFGTLTNNGILNINANGFNSGAVSMTTGTSSYLVNNGGVANVTGAISLLSGAVVAVAPGGALTASGILTLGSGSTAGTAYGIATNYGGTLSVGGVSLNANNASISTSCKFVIAGGINNLGAVNIQRSPGANSAPPALGTDGMIISNGIVNSTSISLGNNAHGIIYLVGGTMTNTGTFTIQNATATRPARFLQTGGMFVDLNTVTMSGTADTVYAALGGTNMVSGFQLNSTTIYFTNSTKMYIGSGGITGSGGTINALLNSGGSFGAATDWTNAVPITLNGGSFDCEDATGIAHNIYSSGVLQGVGALMKTGGGTLTLNAANTFSGSTLINNGTLALGASGSLASPLIVVGSGTTFDVSALAGAYSPSSVQTLSGFGSITGVVTPTQGIIQPGSNSVTGTLTFSDGLTETGGAANNFILPGDKIYVAGAGLKVSGANMVQISGTVTAGSDYTLFDYSGGSFTGDVANFTLAGVTGYLTNDVSARAIKLHATASLRGPASIVWDGSSLAGTTNWNAGVTANWLNGGVPDDFLTGDTANFNGIDSAPLVNVVGNISPGSVVVNNGNYVFTGNGSIIGDGGLTISNGSLTILTTNSYTGPTILAGSSLTLSNIANSVNVSPIGAASVAPGNLVFGGGTLNYFGPTAATDHGITLTNSGGVIDVTGGTTLTLNGSIIGNGALTKTDTGGLTLSVANSYTGDTIISNGTLTLNDPAAAGSGTIQLYDGNLALGAVKPANTINVVANAQITGGNAGGSTGIKNVTGSANLVVSVTTGVFDLTGDMSTYSGTISFANAGGGTIRFNGSTTSDGSALATWDLGAGSMDLNVRVSCLSNNIGALEGGSATTLSGRGGSSNSGATTYYIGANDLSTTFSGIIQNGYGTSGSIPSSSSPTSINKVGSGTLTLDGLSTYTGTTTISSGTLSGSGTVGGATTFSPNTVLAAGDGGIGTLTFGGNLTLDPASTNTFNVTTGGGVSNPVAVSGQLSPNNSVIQITSGTPLADGTYTLFTYSTANGSAFNPTVVFDVAPSDKATIMDDASGHINLQVGPLPASAISSVDYSTLSSGFITVSGTNGPAGASFDILTSTNLAVPFVDWSVGVSGNFDGSGNFTYGMYVDSHAPQLFVVIRVN